MRETRIAIRYAKALFELSLEQKSIEQVNQDIMLVRDVCLQNKDFRLMLSSPIIKTDKKQGVINTLFEGKIGKLSLAYLNIIASKRRENFIEPITEQFLAFYKDYKGVISAVLTTAVPADDKIRGKIKELVKGFTKKEVDLVENIKNEIIGGFVLRFGQYQFDDSIRTKIMKLKREFNINIYEKGF
jgi:F-type H+-transporting ATPase subunit delta